MGDRHKPEELIGKLRETEIVLARGGTPAEEVVWQNWTVR